MRSTSIFSSTMTVISNFPADSIINIFTFSLSLSLYIYIYTYMNKKPVCVSVAQWQLNKKHKVCLTNFRIFLILIHALSSLYKSFSYNSCPCHNHVYFYCYEMSSAWIINNFCCWWPFLIVMTCIYFFKYRIFVR